MSTSILAESRENPNPVFDPTFRIDLGTRSTAVVEPDGDGMIVVSIGDNMRSFLTSAEALAFAAGLQAVAVHLLEEPREIRRLTEPGAPELDGRGGGL